MMKKLRSFILYQGLFSLIIAYSIQNEWKYISIAPMNIYLEPVKFILENLFISAIITVLAGIIISIVI